MFYLNENNHKNSDDNNNKYTNNTNNTNDKNSNMNAIFGIRIRKKITFFSLKENSVQIYFYVLRNIFQVLPGFFYIFIFLLPGVNT